MAMDSDIDVVRDAISTVQNFERRALMEEEVAAALDPVGKALLTLEAFWLKLVR